MIYFSCSVSGMPLIFHADVQAGDDEYKCKICFGFLQGALALFVAGREGERFPGK